MNLGVRSAGMLGNIGQCFLANMKQRSSVLCREIDQAILRAHQRRPGHTVSLELFHQARQSLLDIFAMELAWAQVQDIRPNISDCGV